MAPATAVILAGRSRSLGRSRCIATCPLDDNSGPFVKPLAGRRFGGRSKIHLRDSRRRIGRGVVSRVRLRHDCLYVFGRGGVVRDRCLCRRASLHSLRHRLCANRHLCLHCFPRGRRLFNGTFGNRHRLDLGRSERRGRRLCFDIGPVGLQSWLRVNRHLLLSPRVMGSCSGAGSC